MPAPTPIFTRIECDLGPDAAERFGFVLRQYNSLPGIKPFTPSELAASIITAVLEDEAQAEAVDLRAIPMPGNG